MKAKAKVRSKDKKKTIALLADHELHTSTEIRMLTDNWYVNEIIQELRKEGYNIECVWVSAGLYSYKFMEKPAEKQKTLFD